MRRIRDRSKNACGFDIANPAAIFENWRVTLYHSNIEIFALLGCYAAYIVIYLPTFQVKVPYSRVKQFNKTA